MKARQIDLVLAHLKKGTITPLQAFKEYGISRLGSVICDLRKQGHVIITRLKPVKNRYGETVYVAEYSLEEE